MSKELWKPITGYEQFYEVSNLGKVRCVERLIVMPTYTYIKKSKELTQFKDGRGYLHVKLYDGSGNPKSWTTHRLVALTFIPNPENKSSINHINGNKLDNRLENLEWCTHAENMKHASKLNSWDKSRYVGENNDLSKLTNEQVLTIREEYKNGVKRRELSNKFQTTFSNICNIVERKTWKHL